MILLFLFADYFLFTGWYDDNDFYCKGDISSYVIDLIWFGWEILILYWDWRQGSIVIKRGETMTLEISRNELIRNNIIRNYYHSISSSLLFSLYLSQYLSIYLPLLISISSYFFFHFFQQETQNLKSALSEISSRSKKIQVCTYVHQANMFLILVLFSWRKDRFFMFIQWLLFYYFDKNFRMITFGIFKLFSFNFICFYWILNF